jgi:AbrB family looped-hinge helix DNA binding protein
MTAATIDRYGRVVIPKPVRDRLGLAPGSELTIEERDGGILLKPVETRPLLRRKGHVLVFTGRPAGDLADAIWQQRKERDRVVAGIRDP